MGKYGLGPFQNIVAVHWASGEAARPQYILLTLSVTKKGGGILTNDWLDSEYTEKPIIWCHENNDAALAALANGAASELESVGYKVRVLEETIYYAYFEGSGWREQGVTGGLLDFNKTSMPASETLGGGFGNGQRFGYPYGRPNFSHATGPELDIPHPFAAGERFKATTDVTCFYALTVLGGGPLCYQPFGYRPGDVGWHVYAVESHGARGAEQPVTGFPLNVTYDGQPMTLIGTRTDTAVLALNGQPVSTFCELLFEVPPAA